MFDEDQYIRLIDFGESVIVDNYETELAVSNNTGRRLSMKSFVYSDGSSVFFGRAGKNNGQEQKKRINRRRTLVGTAAYCPPEMVDRGQFGLYTDLWALGTILYEMSTGRQMFTGRNKQEVFDKIQDYDGSKYAFPLTMDEDLKDLIKQLTHKDAQQRIGIKRIHAITSHAFFEGVDFEAISKKI